MFFLNCHIQLVFIYRICQLVVCQLYILLSACLACTHRPHVGGGRGIKANTEIPRRHEAHGRFSLPHKSNSDETPRPKQHTNSNFRWPLSYRSVNIIEEEWRFVKRIRHLKRLDKKIQIVAQQGIKTLDKLTCARWNNGNWQWPIGW